MRRSIRLPGFDYAGPATYLVTFVTYERRPILGEIATGGMNLTDAGKIVREEWIRSHALRDDIQLDAFVVMPDHFHGIVIFTNVGVHSGAPLRLEPQRLRRPSRSLGSFIAQFKASSTSRIHRLHARRDDYLSDSRGAQLCAPTSPRIWQRNYHESILRDENAVVNARRYIDENPARWSLRRKVVMRT